MQFHVGCSRILAVRSHSPRAQRYFSALTCWNNNRIKTIHVEQHRYLETSLRIAISLELLPCIRLAFRVAVSQRQQNNSQRQTPRCREQTPVRKQRLNTSVMYTTNTLKLSSSSTRTPPSASGTPGWHPCHPTSPPAPSASPASRTSPPDPDTQAQTQSNLHW